MKKYAFTREDNGKTVMVPFDKMMEMDCAGGLTLEIKGKPVRLKRVREERKTEKAERLAGVGGAIVSDNMGFGEHALQEMEEDRVRHGLRGVSFVRDKEVPQFFQVHCDGPAAWRRYVKHRGLVDRNSKNGGKASMTQEQFDRSAQLFLSQYDRTKTADLAHENETDRKFKTVERFKKRAKQRANSQG